MRLAALIVSGRGSAPTDPASNREGSMRGLSKVLLTTASAALALTALGAPVAAADDTGTLAVVQGHPGVKVDICIGNKEQRSGKAYGSKYEKDVIGTGTRLLRFFKYDPNKTCGGTLIAKKKLNITPGWDKTVVLTKKAPRIVMFDNTTPFLGEIPPRGAPYAGLSLFAWRHAAEFPANFLYTSWTPNPEAPIAPVANPVWSKGDEIYTGVSSDYFWRVRVTKPEKTDTVAQRTVLMKESRRYEWVLVGTYPGNARFVLLNRGVSQPSP
jgi:hypothetical protein